MTTAMTSRLRLPPEQQSRIRRDPGFTALVSLLLLLLFSFLSTNVAEALVAAPTTKFRRPLSQLFQMSEGPEKSQLNDFVNDYLRRQREEEANNDENNDDDDDDDNEHSPTATSPSSYSHLIAFPVEQCYELMVELESVQRAIIFHCPVLVHACLAAAVTRLPLLYVHGPSAANTNGSGGIGGIGSSSTNSNSDNNGATERLRAITERVVQEVLVVKKGEEGDDDDDDEEDEFDIKRNHGSEELMGPNGENILPVLLEFEGLEIDGKRNECLFTAAQPAKRLHKFVTKLADAITAETGWQTEWPIDPQEEGEASTDFRPRIPFMRLPTDWQKHVEAEAGAYEEEWMVPSEKGGNGISPIFWGKWMNDSFGKAARMRQVGIYPSMGNSMRIMEDYNEDEVRLDEKNFYLPMATVSLPDGNLQLLQDEAKHEAYNEERMRRAELEYKEEMIKDLETNTNVKLESKNSTAAPFDKSDPLFQKTRDRLQKLYEESPDEEQISLDGGDDDDATPKSEAAAASAEVEEDETIEFPQTDPGNPEELDDWMKERIRKIIDSRARVRSQLELSKKKDMPAPEDNPIFEKVRAGKLNPPEQSSSKAGRQQPDMPAFPSNEHCTGFWKTLSSPTGFEVELGDDSRSDNLVLRVDGTVSGGPILDKETRQKASGGSWQLVETTGEKDAKLLIRLSMPPKKERELVMEGKLELMTSSVNLPMASATFGIPVLEKRLARAKPLEEMLYCNGNVWIEDAETGANKDEIGDFSLMKMKTPLDRSEYTITIPRPVRNQD